NITVGARPLHRQRGCASPKSHVAKVVDVGVMAGHATPDVSHRSGGQRDPIGIGGARRDLLLEVLAVHHQLAVLARSNRRFSPSDRLLWLFLRRVWPQWRNALR